MTTESPETFEDLEPQEYAGPWVVAICLYDRVYGGPEEGGWYYEAGYPHPEYAGLMRGFSQDKAGMLAYCAELQDYCDHLNEGRPRVDSVLSNGRFCVRAFEGLPKAWPETRPRYE
jgi:hypothetical protein